MPRRAMRVIWSAMHTGGFAEEHFHRVIERAAEEGVSGVELSARGVETYIAFRDFPALARPDMAERLARRQEALRRITEHAARQKLRFGIWHHEIDGPENLLDRMPELRAGDGLINLESPLLYRFITGKIAEFFDLFPHADELVLTMTETAFPVFRRPFCPLPIPERVYRVLDAVLQATEPRGKLLVIRPFSGVREDEFHVREAVERLVGRKIAMMYKTEPFDWHPFLMDEPLIGSIRGVAVRAETDGGAEYYGQTVFPCSYTGHIRRRLDAAAGRGATTATIRVDRGSLHSALGHPINEANALAPTRWALNPALSMEDCWLDWCRQRHGYASRDLYRLLERTFEVIQKTLYIDQQSFTHNLFPSFAQAKHVQAFGLFEEDVPLAHMRRNWAIVHDRRTLRHEAILAEKSEALRIAQEILLQFDAAGAALPEPARQAIRDSLANLPLLAEACLAFCRVTMAHLQEMLKRTPRTTDPFDVEARRMRELAERIDREKGPNFWIHMADRMRDVVDGLARERAMEMPIRGRIEADANVLDYVLCGFASEGHRLEKMLHSGATVEFGGRMVRMTGIGPDEGVGYTLSAPRNGSGRLIVTLAGSAAAAPGAIRIGEREHAFDPGAFSGFRDIEFGVPSPDAGELKVTIWSTSPAPCRLAQITLTK